ncbi:MAG: hypothetical protein AB1861_15085, partial [Cyanobacteriota bacterium]
EKCADYSISLGSRGSRFVNFMLQKNAGLGQGVFQPIIGISTKLQGTWGSNCHDILTFRSGLGSP